MVLTFSKQIKQEYCFPLTKIVVPNKLLRWKCKLETLDNYIYNCKFSWPYHKVQPPLKSVIKISDTSLNFTLSRQIPNCHFSRIKVQFLKIKWTHKSFNGKLTKYTVWAYLNLKFICINISGRQFNSQKVWHPQI